jgi:hypothetical protein
MIFLTRDIQLHGNIAHPNLAELVRIGDVFAVPCKEIITLVVGSQGEVRLTEKERRFARISSSAAASDSSAFSSQYESLL